MRTHTLVFLLLTAWCSASRVAAQDLPPFGQLPKFDENWKVCDQGKYGDTAFQWHWVVMTNIKSGDLLSFAAHRLEAGEKHDLIYHSDTAHEIFPTGLPSSGFRPSLEARKTEITTSTIRNRVVKLDLPNSAAEKNRTKEALEYTFIAEEENGPNRMAHGYALVFGDLSVYVQHTSLKPITDDLAQDMAYRLIVSRERREAAAKDKPDTTAKPAR
jgi:hypothetical protein